MPLIKVDATANGLRIHDTWAQADDRLYEMATCPGPAIIMVHGYKYAPGTERHCPHGNIFGPTAEAWPRGFGFGNADPEEGVGIAFGWYARGALAKVHRRATGLGKELARLVAILRAKRPGRPVHVVAHSLGAEVALSALEHLSSGAIDRMVLLTGASYQAHALEMLETPAGLSTEILNVISRENDVFDAIFERLVPSPHTNKSAIGRGIKAPNAANLQIDCQASIRALNALCSPIAPPENLCVTGRPTVVRD